MKTISKLVHNDERQDHYQILTLVFKAIVMTCTLNFWVLKRVNLQSFHEFVVTNFNLLINPLHNFFEKIEGSNQRKTFKSSPQDPKGPCHIPKYSSHIVNFNRDKFWISYLYIHIVIVCDLKGHHIGRDLAQIEASFKSKLYSKR